MIYQTQRQVKKNQLNDLLYSYRLQSVTFTALGTQPNYTMDNN